MPEPHDETLTDEEIETRPIGGADPRLADDTGDDADTGDDTGDTSDTADTGDDSGDSGDDS
jgi:hypothetical protein